jgi:hypothetical protein
MADTNLQSSKQSNPQLPVSEAMRPQGAETMRQQATQSQRYQSVAA